MSASRQLQFGRFLNFVTHGDNCQIPSHLTEKRFRYYRERTKGNERDRHVTRRENRDVTPGRMQIAKIAPLLRGESTLLHGGAKGAMPPCPSERIREEIAASKRKGLWVGGCFPLATTARMAGFLWLKKKLSMCGLSSIDFLRHSHSP